MGSSEGFARERKREKEPSVEAALDLLMRKEMPLPANMPLAKKLKAFLASERRVELEKKLADHRIVENHRIFRNYAIVKEYLERHGRWGVAPEKPEPRQSV